MKYTLTIEEVHLFNVYYMGGGNNCTLERNAYYMGEYIILKQYTEVVQQDFFFSAASNALIEAANTYGIQSMKMTSQTADGS